MSKLKEAIAEMKDLNMNTKFEDFDLTAIKKADERLSKKVDKVIECDCDYQIQKNILDKSFKGEPLSTKEIKNIPFVLYDERCTAPIFIKLMTQINTRKRNHVSRLINVYLKNYDETNKTSVIANVILKILNSDVLDKSNNFLDNAKKMQLFLFADIRMDNMAKLIGGKNDLNEVMDFLQLSDSFDRCNFIQEAVKNFFVNKDNRVEKKYHYLISIKDITEYQRIMTVIATHLIPGIERLKKIEYKNNVRNIFYDKLGDPRFGPKRIKWNDVSEEAKKIFLHWLAEKDLNLFFKIIEETAVDDMWSYRKHFWQNYLPKISNTWVMLGRDALDCARRLKISRNSYGELKRGQANHSVFAFQIGEFVFIEFSHNGKLRVWDADNAPDIFGKREIDKNDITSSDKHIPKKDWIHSSKETNYWQKQVELWLGENVH